MTTTNSVEQDHSKTTSVCPSSPSSVYELLCKFNTRDIGVNTDIFQTSNDDMCVMFNLNSIVQSSNVPADVPVSIADASSSNKSAIQLQMTSERGSFPFLNSIIRMNE